MAIRILRRKVIIREYDYRKVYTEALLPLSCMGIKDTLYDRAEFTPLNYEALEKLKLVEILKGKQYSPLVKSEWNNGIPAMLLFDLKDYLYDIRYYDWEVTVDEDGYLCVQARKNTPKTRLGWAVFEKDIESRI
jgi:hypothetical protein